MGKMQSFLSVKSLLVHTVTGQYEVLTVVSDGHTNTKFCRPEMPLPTLTFCQLGQ